jgi:hypothetical protein
MAMKIFLGLLLRIREERAFLSETPYKIPPTPLYQRGVRNTPIPEMKELPSLVKASGS